MPVWELIAHDAEKGARVLVEEYAARLYATAFRICQNEKDAEDLVQRTFARVLERIRFYSSRSAFFTWMCAILINFHRMDMRRKAANALVFVEKLPETNDTRPCPAAEMEATDESAMLRAAVDKLPAEVRMVIVLHYFADMAVPEIAKALDAPEGTVYWRLHEGRRMVREAVSKGLRPGGI